MSRGGLISSEKALFAVAKEVESFATAINIITEALIVGSVGAVGSPHLEEEKDSGVSIAELRILEDEEPPKLGPPAAGKTGDSLTQGPLQKLPLPFARDHDRDVMPTTSWAPRSVTKAAEQLVERQNTCLRSS